MKQTAIQWLMYQMLECVGNREDDTMEIIIPRDAFNKALEMEKEQLCFFYVKGAEAELNNPYITNIEFYNKQFKNK